MRSQLSELMRLSKAADSIALGDRVDAVLRGSQNWSLLTDQVRPRSPGLTTI